MQRVIAAGFDGVENGYAAAGEHIEVDAQAALDHFGERGALDKEIARANDQIFHQADVTRVETAFDDIGFHEAVGCGDIERNIDAAFFEVAIDVLPKIGELESGAGGVRQRLALFVAIAAKIEDEAADGIRGKNAVADHGVPSRITLDGLVLAEGAQEIGEGLFGNILGRYGLAQREEDGMRRAAVVAIVEFALPPIEEFEGALFLRDFVAEIIGPAAIGVEVVEMLPQPPRQHAAGDGEILVVAAGQPPAVAAASPQRRRLGHLHLRSVTLQVAGKRRGQEVIPCFAKPRA